MCGWIHGHRTRRGGAPGGREEREHVSYRMDVPRKAGRHRLRGTEGGSGQSDRDSPGGVCSVVERGQRMLLVVFAAGGWVTEGVGEGGSSVWGVEREGNQYTEAGGGSRNERRARTWYTYGWCRLWWMTEEAMFGGRG
mmetsp:Transcript_2181/g.6471  ORF Transcript_2181/g.6471 Transcript_2181/m.6471 type:complete len:138 (+) Transcript_2181:305-718(+)